MPRIRRRLALLGIGIVTFLGVAGLAAPTDTLALNPYVLPANTLAPDLGALAPRNITIEQVRVKGKVEKRLRFDTLMANTGAGPLEIYPGTPGCDSAAPTATRDAYQHVYKDTNGLAGFQRTSTVVGGKTVPADASDSVWVGCMVFHPRHHHWHVEGFAAYRLYVYTVTGAIDPNPVAISNKVSFCMLDMEWEGGGAAPAPYYTACGENVTMGISVNWADNYYSGLADQWIVISGTPAATGSGTYCLVNIGNIAAIEPMLGQAGKQLPGLVESSPTHDSNASGVQIVISNNGMAVSPPGGSCLPPSWSTSN